MFQNVGLDIIRKIIAALEEFVVTALDRIGEIKHAQARVPLVAALTTTARVPRNNALLKRCAMISRRIFAIVPNLLNSICTASIIPLGYSPASGWAHFPKCGLPARTNAAISWPTLKSRTASNRSNSRMNCSLCPPHQEREKHCGHRVQCGALAQPLKKLHR